jgi:polyphosphate kinase
MSFINRELSWLEFNQRVLDIALDASQPLLERLKFLAITSSNLDEFFQVRVGGLTLQQLAAPRTHDLAGLTPSQQLAAIRKRVLALAEQQYALLNETLLPAMREADISLLSVSDLTAPQLTVVSRNFSEFIAPLLTPLAYDPDASEFHLPDLQIIIACRLENEEEESSRIAFVPVPENLPRFVAVSTGGNDHYLYIEDLVRARVSEIFPGERVAAAAPFRITRNSDIAVQDEDTTDLADKMEDVLAARRFGKTVRVQVSSGTPRDLLRIIQEVTDSGPSELYRAPGPLALADFMQLSLLSGHPTLQHPDWTPQPSPLIEPGLSMFETIAKQDLLLMHPYESFDPVVRLIEEAADDPQVLAIKQVLYRTASDSRIIRALIRAAESGKQVTVLVELKARFDEERNLARAEALQRAGVQIVYGVKGLKTHAKITLIARNENGRLRRYVHLGTGNYNESTAQLYTDISYLTASQEFGSDASMFFNAVTGRSQLVRLERLVPAPMFLKRRLLELIEAETNRAEQGEPARIMAKMNSLQDADIINALYLASRAGVQIQLNVRGICCLKTGSRKAAKNIEVVSIIDRYLEHARIYYFHQGGDPVVYISSADLMTRNLEKRVELMIPVEDAASQRRLIRMLESCFRDNANSFDIVESGKSQRRTPPKGKKRFRLQEHLYKEAVRSAKSSMQERATTFEPHRPPE